MPTQKFSPLPSVEKLRELFDCDLETGELTWRVNLQGRGAKIGNRAGSDKADGSRSVMIDRKRYLVHRIIWKLANGSDPAELIDHRKGNPEFSGIRNLREASCSQNVHNTKKSKNNTTGVKGVYFFDNGNNTYYLAKFSHNHKIHYCGYHATIPEAAAAVQREREKIHGEFACHGEREAA